LTLTPGSTSLLSRELLTVAPDVITGHVETFHVETFAIEGEEVTAGIERVTV